MAVHVAALPRAIMECKLLMMATSNIFSPSSGKPILTPSQDMSSAPTISPSSRARSPEERNACRSPAACTRSLFAVADGALKKHDWVDVSEIRISVARPSTAAATRKTFRNHVGRVIFNQIWPKELGFVNFPVPKAKLGDLILNTYKVAGEVLNRRDPRQAEGARLPDRHAGGHLDRDR